jgi:hypothetical protein
MAILFVMAPVQIYYKVLPLIEEKKFEKLLIITTKELAPFFKEHTKAEVIVPNVHPNLITSTTKYKIITNIAKSHLEYSRLFKEVKNEEIYLFFTSWSVVYLSYVAKLSKRNKVYLCTEKNLSDLYKEENSLRALFMKLIARFFLGVNVFILNKSGLPVWELNRDSIQFEYLDINLDLTSASNYISDSEILKNKNILFIGDAILSEGADEKSVVELTNNIMSIFENNFNDEYIIKPHPRVPDLYGKMKESNSILPPHVIVESIMGHKWKFIIGYYSEALVSAKIYTDAIVISLLNLWKWNNSDLKKFWKEKFLENGILLPKSIDELMKLLNVKITLKEL